MHDPLEELRWREEILQALYWMRGEGIATEVTTTQLASFLAEPAEEVALQLERLVERGDIERTPAGTYGLTDAVLQEAGELFRREFDDMVNHSSHGAECSRPDCFCHTLGPDACVGPISATNE